MTLVLKLEEEAERQTMKTQMLKTGVDLRVAATSRKPANVKLLVTLNTIWEDESDKEEATISKNTPRKGSKKKRQKVAQLS